MASSPLSLRVEVGKSSVAGAKEVNEDCCGTHIPDAEEIILKGVAAVIADGVSAAAYGKEAAEMCVRSFLLDYFSTPDSWSVKKSCQKVINGLNRWLYGQGQSLSLDSEKGYVSTMSVMVLHSNSAEIFHIGDTRIARIRRGDVEDLTRDHNSKISSKVTYLNRAMGLNLTPKVDYQNIEVEEGDIYLFTSDGVHEYINTKDVLQSLSELTLDDSAEFLTQLALKNGSPDNLTSMFIRVNELAKASQEETKNFLIKRPFPPVLTPGNLIDGLEVEKVLFESARSQLYRVRDVKEGAVYAMKTPSANFVDDPAYIERFATEEWVGKRVKNDNLIKVVDREQKPRFLYYLMEEIEGVSLADYMKQKGGVIEYREVLKIIKQIVSGVRALHRMDTLHQDLKLDNVMLCDGGLVKVIDYGSCRVASIEAREVAFERETVLGTMDFGAPEYRVGTEGSAQSDQFSIAMIAYKLLTGGASPYGERWEKARSREDFGKLIYQSVLDEKFQIPHFVDFTLKKALSVDPAKRYEALSEFLSDMENPNSNSGHNHSTFKPLIERDPVLLWKMVSLVLTIVVVILIIIILSP